MGAEGIGLCRTEHMFLGERKQFVERLILAEDDGEREEALDALLPLQRKDFVRILEAMDGLPVTIRLLDPPLHEFLPDLTELSVRVALAESRGETSEADLRLLQAVNRLHESEPDARSARRAPGAGHAGPVRAAGARDRRGGLLPAAAGRRPAGRDHDPAGRVACRSWSWSPTRRPAVLAEVAEAHGCTLKFPIGTMIELPRAALTAGQIAEAAEFFSFGTNDLTQTTWGFSRDDVEAGFFSAYLERGRVRGVAVRVHRPATVSAGWSASPPSRGGPTRPDLHCRGLRGARRRPGVSIHFFHEVGLDYVSCSPFRVPVARLEAGRAALETAGSDTR